MEGQNISAITSEDYADLIINYSGDESILRAFPDSIIEIVNFIYAIVHIPVSQITNDVIQLYGYSAMPKLFGLISHASLEASGVTRLRNIPNFNLRGSGVLLGIIDTGIDYTNPVFQNADGTTRIVSIWDQTIDTGPSPEGLSYGTLYTREQLNQALQSDNPLDIVPSMDEVGHGTMVAGVAGGTENIEMDFMGIATEAEFVIVKLKQAKRYLKNFFFVPAEALAYQENDILIAYNYLQSIAYQLEKPIVICQALGTSQGGHGGRGILSNFVSLIAGTPGMAVVLAGGNEGNSRRHYAGRVNPSTKVDIVELNVGENEQSFSMELWGRSPSIYSIDITSPSGEYVPRITADMNDNREISFVFEQTIIYIDFQMVEAQTGDQLILLRFEKPAPGIWKFNIYERGDLDLGFNIWLPMGDFISENIFFTRSDPYTTILAPGNAQIPLTVTAYNTADDSLFLQASRGYNISGGITPQIAAPGVNITGPNLEKGFTTFSGTSVSAAHTAGVTALIMEWGNVRGSLRGISTVEIKKLMIRGARRNLDIIYPNRDWGYGILDLYNVFESLRTGVVV